MNGNLSGVFVRGNCVVGLSVRAAPLRRNRKWAQRESKQQAEYSARAADQH